MAKLNNFWIYIRITFDVTVPKSQHILVQGILQGSVLGPLCSYIVKNIIWIITESAGQAFRAPLCVPEVPSSNLSGAFHQLWFFSVNSHTIRPILPHPSLPTPVCGWKDEGRLSSPPSLGREWKMGLCIFVRNYNYLVTISKSGLVAVFFLYNERIWSECGQSW